MEKGKRSITKRLRFLALQAQQLDQLLIDHNMIFTDFVHGLIEYAFMKNQYTVLKLSELPPVPEPTKRHRRPEKIVQRPGPDADPMLLLEIGRIGNNINQIARALNYLCNADRQQQQRFSFVECLHVLHRIQAELHAVLGELPAIHRSEQAVKRARDRAIFAVLEIENEE
jgi:hypothetical protein